jgi:hypothetical protein
MAGPEAGRPRVATEGEGQRPEADERPPRGRSDPASPADETWSAADIDPATTERGLRGLVGGGASQVSPAAALRARDAARPGAADLARAEAELRIVRRNWTPRD